MWEKASSQREVDLKTAVHGRAIDLTEVANKFG
jgi:hypothetical protein